MISVVLVSGCVQAVEQECPDIKLKEGDSITLMKTSNSLLFSIKDVQAVGWKLNYLPASPLFAEKGKNPGENINYYYYGFSAIKKIVDDSGYVQGEIEREGTIVLEPTEVERKDSFKDVRIKKIICK